jgi:hypothetical protein
LYAVKQPNTQMYSGALSGTEKMLATDELDPRPPRFIRDSSLIRPVAFDKCLFLKIPRIVCPSSDFNVTHILVYATKNTYE